ncbi:hypothetical protein C6P45_001244 [Maudiozyma exigua]|uniref:Uncharacterized protein n=1 Tax=Maudiozyma exigua TaxID=34358 RepID=A0A9P6W2I6_MAUEX|nr:hypothetical protein C6P45_001244 [Kazachstania exigua]
MLVRNSLLRSSRMLQFQAKRNMATASSDIIARANSGRAGKFVVSEFKRITTGVLGWGSIFAVALFWCSPLYYYKKSTSFGLAHA